MCHSATILVELGWGPTWEDVVGDVIVGINKAEEDVGVSHSDAVAPGGSVQLAATQVMVSPSMTSSPSITWSGVTILPFITSSAASRQMRSARLAD